jgi:quinol monooxygenase YgiN
MTIDSFLAIPGYRQDEAPSMLCLSNKLDHPAGSYHTPDVGSAMQPANPAEVDFRTVITTFGTLHLNPAQRDNALQEYLHLVEESRKEPGCYNYVVSADLVDPMTLYIFEEWADEDTREAHRQSEHFIAHRTRSAGHIVAAEINHYQSGSVERNTIGSGPRTS